MMAKKCEFDDLEVLHLQIFAPKMKETKQLQMQVKHLFKFNRRMEGTLQNEGIFFGLTVGLTVKNFLAKLCKWGLFFLRHFNVVFVVFVNCRESVNPRSLDSKKKFFFNSEKCAEVPFRFCDKNGCSRKDKKDRVFQRKKFWCEKTDFLCVTKKFFLISRWWHGQEQIHFLFQQFFAIFDKLKSPTVSFSSHQDVFSI